MAYTVFWSWQGDLTKDSNRWFISHCLMKAVKQVNKTFDVVGRETVDLDEATKGEPGMAEIDQMIFKKIDECAVMVADVTPIIETKTGKHVPNPNVLIELGYAMGARGLDHIIAIMNTSYGNIDDLPFDIRNKRILYYHLKKNANENERNEECNNLIGKLKDAIKSNLDKVLSERLILGWQHDSRSRKNDGVFGWLQYNSKIDKFFEPKEAITKLCKFSNISLNDQPASNFQWMLLTGEAGVGKTRLAYEFVTDKQFLGKKWYKGKLDFDDHNSIADVRDWFPFKPTFFVIDDAQRLLDEVKATLTTFCRRAKNFKYPVRVLLLERSANKIWTNKINNSQIKQHNFEQVNFTEKAVTGCEIKPLSEDSIFKLMEGRFEEADCNIPTRSQLRSIVNIVDQSLKSLGSKDINRSPSTLPPLYAIATAEAIIIKLESGQEFPDNLEVDEIFKIIIDRERVEKWQKIKSCNSELLWKHEMGLAVATLAQEMLLRELKDVTTEWLPPQPPGHYKELLEAFGCYGDELRWHPMKPDTLGEFFTLQQLRKKELTPNDRIKLIKCAMEIGKDRTIVTLSGMARNFPKLFIDLQLEMIASDTKQEEEILMNLIHLVVHLTSYNLTPECAWDIFFEVCKNICNGWKKFSKLSNLVAKAAFNVCVDAIELDNWDRVEFVLKDVFDQLRISFPDEPEIALKEVGTAGSICTKAGEKANWDRVDEMLRRIDVRRKEFPNDDQIALEDCRASSNTFLVARNSRNPAHFEEMKFRIRTLAKEFPHVSEITETANCLEVPTMRVIY